MYKRQSLHHCWRWALGTPERDCAMTFDEALGLVCDAAEGVTFHCDPADAIELLDAIEIVRWVEEL